MTHPVYQQLFEQSAMFSFLRNLSLLSSFILGICFAKKRT